MKGLYTTRHTHALTTETAVVGNYQFSKHTHTHTHNTDQQTMTARYSPTPPQTGAEGERERRETYLVWGVCIHAFLTCVAYFSKQVQSGTFVPVSDKLYWTSLKQKNCDKSWIWALLLLFLLSVKLHLEQEQPLVTPDPTLTRTALSNCVELRLA